MLRFKKWYLQFTRIYLICNAMYVVLIPQSL